MYIEQKAKALPATGDKRGYSTELATLIEDAAKEGIPVDEWQPPRNFDKGIPAGVPMLHDVARKLEKLTGKKYH